MRSHSSGPLPAANAPTADPGPTPVRHAGAPPAAGARPWGALPFWIVAAPLLAGWAALYLAWPFAMDHGAFAWVADVIRAGGLPYRDAWEVKGPLVYYLVALADLCFGDGFRGIRLFDLVVLAVGMVPVYRTVRSWASPAAGITAVALFLLWYASLDFENTAQPDGWAGLLLAASAMLMLTGERPRRPGAALLAGALIGACTLVKPTYGMFLLMPFGYATAGEGWERGGRVRFLAAAGIGFVLPLALATAWFAAHGALDDWVNVQVVWTTRVYTGLGLPWSARIHKTLDALVTGRFAPALPFAAAGLWAIRKRDRGGAALMLAWGGATLVTVLLQGKPWPYLWLPFFAPVAVLTGIGLHEAWRVAAESRSVPASPTRPILLALVAVLFTSAALVVLDELWNGKALLRGGPAAVAYDREEFGKYGRGPESLAAAAGYVRARTRPNDRVLTWGMSGAVNHLAGRRSPSRFGVNMPLVGGKDAPLRRAYRREFMERLAAAPPVYVVVDVVDCGTPAANDMLGDFPELAGFLARGYHLERRVGCSRILRANRP